MNNAEFAYRINLNVNVSGVQISENLIFFVLHSLCLVTRCVGHDVMSDAHIARVYRSASTAVKTLHAKAPSVTEF
jgi:hypothetical protein